MPRKSDSRSKRLRTIELSPEAADALKGCSPTSTSASTLNEPAARTPHSGNASKTSTSRPNAHTFYKACDDACRCLCNQGFFTKIPRAENPYLRSEFTSVYETVLDSTDRLHA